MRFSRGDALVVRHVTTLRLLAGGGGRRPRVLPHPVAPAVDVPGTVDEVRELTLVLVETDEHRRVWNTLMADEHPRGAGPFVGPQLRYLVGSGHGWLGGVGFAASARRLRARDAWIGWDEKRRGDYLHRTSGQHLLEATDRTRRHGINRAPVRCWSSSPP